MSTFSTLLLDVAGGVATLTLNRPEKRNALNFDMCNDLRAAIDAVSANTDARVLLVMGNGPSFCAGADLKERDGKTPDWMRERRRRSYAAYMALSAIEIPAIAVVDGMCAGSGCEIATACDFILASENAQFRYPEAQLGTVGATQRLPRIVGKALAKELLFTGRTVGAEEAKAVGLINRIIPADKLRDEALAMAQHIAKAPPLAMRLAKRSIDLGMETNLERGVAIEALAVERCLADTEWKTGVANFVAGKKE
jgi:enoyl-CoA hydratase/carnithine racemase